MAAKKKVAAFDPARAAKELAPGAVRTYPGADARSIQLMGKQGLRSLRDARAQLATRLKDWNEEPLTRFSALLEAFAQAAVEVERSEPLANDELARDTDRGFALRRLLLNSAEGAVLAGHVPAPEFERIHKGRGRLDAANDLSALVELHRSHAAAFKNKTYVTDALLDEAAALGERLGRALKPASAKRLTPAELGKARDLRNRLFTLLSLAHDDLWNVAAFIFGKHHVDEAFPSLLARAPAPAPKKPAKKAEPEAPAEG